VSAVEHLRAAFGLSRALDITADRITAYAARRQEAGAQPATVNRELSALKRMFRLGQRAGKVGERPLHRRPVFETAYLTGWRVKSELLRRQRHHVDLAAGWLRLEPGERRRTRAACSR
jgi:hypothetical protein